jgi:hypothetical protein
MHQGITKPCDRGLRFSLRHSIRLHGLKLVVQSHRGATHDRSKYCARKRHNTRPYRYPAARDFGHNFLDMGSLRSCPGKTILA